MSLIGGLLDEFRQDPLRMMCKLHRENGDIAQFRLGPKRFRAVFEPEMLREIMITKADAFHKGGAFGEVKRLTGEGLVLSEGELHKKQRRIMQPKFTRSHVQRYAEQMTASTLSHISQWGEGGQRQLADELFKITFDIIARSMFSFDSSRQLEDIGKAFDSVIRIASDKIRALVRVPLVIPTAQNREYLSALRVLDTVVYELIAARRKQSSGLPAQDLMSILMEAVDESEDGTGMNDTQLRDELITMFLAGHETTANTLAWAIDYIMKHPEVEEKLRGRAEPGRPGTGEPVRAHASAIITLSAYSNFSLLLRLPDTLLVPEQLNTMLPLLFVPVLPFFFSSFDFEACKKSSFLLIVQVGKSF